MNFEKEKMTSEEFINHLDGIYISMKTLLRENDPYTNYVVLETLNEVYNMAVANNISEDYLKKYLQLINEVKKNHKIEKKVSTKLSPFNDSEAIWNIEKQMNELIVEEDVRMTKEEAINEYIKKFGGFPYSLFMGASDEVIIEAVEKAIKTGEEIYFDKEENSNVSY